jgi:hypothetical protein
MNTKPFVVSQLVWLINCLDYTSPSIVYRVEILDIQENPEGHTLYTVYCAKSPSFQLTVNSLSLFTTKKRAIQGALLSRAENLEEKIANLKRELKDRKLYRLSHVLGETKALIVEQAQENLKTKGYL